MPDKNKREGKKGLASMLKYLIELKCYNDAVQAEHKCKNDNVKTLTGEKSHNQQMERRKFKPVTSNIQQMFQNFSSKF